MFKNNQQFLKYIGFHIALAVLVFVVPILSTLYSLSIVVFGILFIFNRKNKNNEALLVAGYIVGSEVFIRATGGVFFYEYAKYGIVLVLLVGMVFKGVAKSAFIFWFYLLLLIPSTILALFVLDINSEYRKVISFTISGPVCLGISALYCYRRKITFENMQNIIVAIGLPVVSLVTYLILFNPSVKEVVKGTDSNFATSGGFGPNQVATALGLGAFIFVMRALLASKNQLILFTNFAIASVLAYRGIVTFSRGGMLTCVAMIAILLVNLYYISNIKVKAKLSIIIIFLGIAGASIWVYSSSQTNGLIDKRYANQDVTGKVKKSNFSGREEIGSGEIDMFIENPVLGVGVGRSAQIREEASDKQVASHNEITRLLAEHGSLGVLILLILVFTPVGLFFKNKKNIFVLPFLVFWGLTINHAAMRTAAPAFVYALALLKVTFGQPLIRKTVPSSNIENAIL